MSNIINNDSINYVDSYFSIIPDQLMRDPELSSKAKVIYCILISYDKKNYCVPGIKLIKEHSGFHHETISIAINELENTGWVKKMDHPKDKRRNLYKIYRNNPKYIIKDSSEIPNDTDLTNSEIPVTNNKRLNNKRPLGGIDEFSFKELKQKYDDTLIVSDNTDQSKVIETGTGEFEDIDLLGKIKRVEICTYSYPDVIFTKWQFSDHQEFESLKNQSIDPGISKILYQGIYGGKYHFISYSGDQETNIYRSIYKHHQTVQEYTDKVKDWASIYKYKGIDRDIDLLGAEKLSDIINNIMERHHGGEVKSPAGLLRITMGGYNVSR